MNYYKYIHTCITIQLICDNHIAESGQKLEITLDCDTRVGHYIRIFCKNVQEKILRKVTETFSPVLKTLRENSLLIQRRYLNYSKNPAIEIFIVLRIHSRQTVQTCIYICVCVCVYIYIYIFLSGVLQNILRCAQDSARGTEGAEPLGGALLSRHRADGSAASTNSRESSIKFRRAGWPWESACEAASKFQRLDDSK